MNGDIDFGAVRLSLFVTGQMFIDRIIEDFKDHVVQTAFIGVADVHARPLSHRFEALKFVDLGGIVFLPSADSSGTRDRNRFHGQIVVGFRHRRWSRDHG